MSRGIEKWFVPDANPRCIKSSVTGHYIPVTIENIRLMAASPDFLAAALMLIDTIEGGTTKVDDAITATRAAIAKATGEA